LCVEGFDCRCYSTLKHILILLQNSSNLTRIMTQALGRTERTQVIVFSFVLLLPWGNSPDNLQCFHKY
jgi:hypothetical protein